jgi:hypothetical protein
MRHTYASFALDAGVSIFELARLMGTSVKVIDSAYGGTSSATRSIASEQRSSNMHAGRPRRPKRRPAADLQAPGKTQGTSGRRYCKSSGAGFAALMLPVADTVTELKT